MTVTFNPPKPILTTEDVERWRSELAELNERISVAQLAAAVLLRKLDAAAVLMPELEDAQSSSWRKDSEASASSGATLYDAIQRVVAASRSPMTPKMIRNAIAHSADAGLIGSQNYLYTAIKRVADKGLIIKEDEGYVLGPLS